MARKAVLAIRITIINLLASPRLGAWLSYEHFIKLMVSSAVYLSGL